jgi:TRAP-type transport system periplasmic protein
MPHARITTSRKTFVGGVAGAYATIGVARYPAGAAEFTYRFATEWPRDHFMAVRWTEAAAKIKNDSSGRLEIQIFTNGVLGGQGQIISQLRLGAVEFNTAIDLVLADLVPVAGITAAPFVFSNHKEALNAMNGPLGRYRRNAIAKLNLYPLPQIWDTGFRQLTNSVRPINVPDDLKGLKIRTPGSALSNALFKAFGAIPTALSSSEEYTGLQTHLIDGAGSPMDSIESHRLYEVQKYVAYTNYVWSMITVLVNGDAWQRLPKPLRDIVERNAEVAANLGNADSARLDSSLESTLTTQGMVFTHPNLAPFRAIVQKAGIYVQSRDTYGAEAWALLERAVGKLT